MEFAVGHGTSIHGVMNGRECRAIQTTWMPQCEVERVEPAELKNVELGMEAIAAAPDAATLRASLSSLVAEYGKWIDEQTAAAPKEKHRVEVPIFPWPAPAGRTLRVSLPAYAEVDDVRRLADVL